MTRSVFLHLGIGLNFRKETEGRTISQTKKTKVNTTYYSWVPTIQGVKLDCIKIVKLRQLLVFLNIYVLDFTVLNFSKCNLS